MDQATAHSLPVKLHTGYYAGQNSMPLSRLRLKADSLDLVDPILHNNARQIFRLAQKTETLRQADWGK